MLQVITAITVHASRSDTDDDTWEGSIDQNHKGIVQLQADVFCQHGRWMKPSSTCNLNFSSQIKCIDLVAKMSSLKHSNDKDYDMLLSRSCCNVRTEGGSRLKSWGPTGKRAPCALPSPFFALPASPSPFLSGPLTAQLTESIHQVLTSAMELQLEKTDR
jgi:hypothetical protein